MMTRHRAIWIVLLPCTLALGACDDGEEPADEPNPEHEQITCVEVNHEHLEGERCSLTEGSTEGSPEGCGEVWQEDCKVLARMSCVSMATVARTIHEDTTCQELGYDIECGDEWVTQDYVDSWPFGYDQACPDSGQPEPSEPDSCGSCGSFGSHGRCCGGAYCAGECIGDPCC